MAGLFGGSVHIAEHTDLLPKADSMSCPTIRRVVYYAWNIPFPPVVQQVNNLTHTTLEGGSHETPTAIPAGNNIGMPIAFVLIRYVVSAKRWRNSTSRTSQPIMYSSSWWNRVLANGNPYKKFPTAGTHQPTDEYRCRARPQRLDGR